MERMINVSVENLVVGIQLENIKAVPIAVMHPTDNRKPLQALSAGSRFPEEARNYIIKAFDADSFGFSGDNAQCRIPEGMIDIFQDWLEAQYFLDSDTALIDRDPYPELRKKLTGNYWSGIIPPLFNHHFNKLRLRVCSRPQQPLYFRQTLQSEEAYRGSEIEVKFFLKLVMVTESNKVFSLLEEHPAIFCLDKEALKSTEGGKHQGKFEKYVLANNIGVQHYQPEPA